MVKNVNNATVDHLAMVSGAERDRADAKEAHKSPILTNLDSHVFTRIMPLESLQWLCQCFPVVHSVEQVA